MSEREWTTGSQPGQPGLFMGPLKYRTEISPELKKAETEASLAYAVYIRDQLGDLPMAPKPIISPSEFDDLTREELLEIAENSPEWGERKTAPNKMTTTKLRYWCRDNWTPPKPPTIRTLEDIEGLQRGEMVAWMQARGEKWNDKRSTPPACAPKVVIKQRIRSLVEADMERGRADRAKWARSAPPVPSPMPVRVPVETVDIEDNTAFAIITGRSQIAPCEPISAVLCNQSGVPMTYETRLTDTGPTPSDMATICEAIDRLLDVFCDMPTEAIRAAILERVNALGRFCPRGE